MYYDSGCGLGPGGYSSKTSWLHRFIDSGREKKSLVRHLFWSWALKIKKKNVTIFLLCTITLLETDRVPDMAFILPVKGDL